MGCGGSKEAVATGNTSSAGGGSKLLRRKSSVVSTATGASHTSSTSSSSSSGNTGVAVKDVVKDAAVVAGEPKADAREEKPVSVDSKAADAIVVMSLEKPAAAAAVVVEAKKEEEVVVVLNKDVAADDVASAPTPAAAAVAIEAAAAEPEPEPEQDNKVVVVVEEDLLPESTMADEAPVEEAPEVEEQAKELAPLKLKLKDVGEEKTVESKNLEEEEHKATSPAPTNEDGESAGQMQNTTEPVEAKPAVDEHKAEEKTITTDEQTAATVASEAPAN